MIPKLEAEILNNLNFQEDLPKEQNCSSFKKAGKKLILQPLKHCRFVSGISVIELCISN